MNLNIAFRWSCRLNLHDKVPEHSSLTRIRDRFGQKTYATIFECLIDQWLRSGIIKGKRLIADASLVEADASLNSMKRRDDAAPEAKALKQYEQRYHDFREGKKQRKLSNQTHVSQSDPGSSLVSRKGTYRKLAYKVHYSIDAETRIITDCHATTGARHEGPVLPERVDYQTDSLHLPISEIIADRGYGRGPTYSYFRAKHIRTYIPLHTDRCMGLYRTC